jgi:hypothetical protein
MVEEKQSGAALSARTSPHGLHPAPVPRPILCAAPGAAWHAHAAAAARDGPAGRSARRMISCDSAPEDEASDQRVRGAQTTASDGGERGAGELLRQRTELEERKSASSERDQHSTDAVLVRASLPTHA